MGKEIINQPLISDDLVVFCLLIAILALIFYTSGLKNAFFRKFYAVIPPLLLCYFLPGLLNTTGVISGGQSKLYDISSNLLLPACLVTLTLNLNVKELWRLRKKAGLMFITGTAGILIGGPLAVLIMSDFAPHVVGGVGAHAVWRGLATIAGSWIGGGANEAALYRIFNPSPQLYSQAIAVDAFVAYGWMAVLLYCAGKSKQLDLFLKADSKIVNQLVDDIDASSEQGSKMPETKDIMIILGIAFGATGIAHLFSGRIAGYIKEAAPTLGQFSLTSDFFWLILIATIIGILLSFTPARKLESRGASQIGTVFLYILIATIGMQMDITAILTNPGLFIVGIIWMSFHALLLFLVARLIRAPFFFLAVGSMANVGGVASASVVAGAFNRSLVPIGVLLAVLGYAIGTYAGYLCGILMQWASH